MRVTSICICIVVVAVIALDVVRTANPKTVDRHVVEARLRDGSTLRGVLKDDTISATSAVGKLTIPVDQFASVAFGEEGEEALLVLMNGDRIHIHSSVKFALETQIGEYVLTDQQLTRLSVLSEVPMGDLAFRLSFDLLDGTLTPDSTGHGYNATGRGVRLVPGRKGNAVELDGSSSLLRLAEPMPLVHQAFSVGAWVKTTGNGTWQQCIISKGNNADGGMVGMFLRLEHDGRPSLRVGNGGTPFNVVGPASVADGRWHHVAAAVSTDDGMLLWVDGKLVARQPFTSIISYRPYPMTIGCYAGNYTQPNSFKGDLDEITYFSRVLTTDEVRELAMR